MTVKDMSKGAKVMLQCGGHTSTGTVVVCSEDRQSLAVELDPPGEVYSKVMPLEVIAGEYRELVKGETVKVSVMQRAGSSRYNNRPG